MLAALRCRRRGSSIRRASKRQNTGIKGHGGGNKIKGHKRHLIIDTLGLLLRVKVLSANLSDREGGKQLLSALHEERPALKLHL